MMIIYSVYSKLVNNVFALKLNLKVITYLCKDENYEKQKKLKMVNKSSFKTLPIRWTFSHMS